MGSKLALFDARLLKPGVVEMQVDDMSQRCNNRVLSAAVQGLTTVCLA